MEMKELLKQILKDKFVKIAFLTLLVLYLVILFADFIAPYSKYYSNRDLSYAPPSKIYTITTEGKFSLPYTYNYIREFEPALMQTIYKQDRSQKHYLKLCVRGDEYKILGIIPCNIHLFGVDNGGQLYLLGTAINLKVLANTWYCLQ